MNSNALYDFFPGIPDLVTIEEASFALRMDVVELQSLLQNEKVQAIPMGENLLIPKVFLCEFVAQKLTTCYDVNTASSPLEAQDLGNCIAQSDFLPSSEGENEMAKKSKFKQPIAIHGTEHWICANTAQQFADKVILLAEASQQSEEKHLFSDYAWTWYNIYSKPNVATATATTYKRQLDLHILPVLGELMVEDITTDHIQALFNGMAGAKATKDKARMVLNQIMDAAVEDGIIHQNPVKSRRVKVTGKASKTTQTYSVEQMQFLVKHIENVQNQSDRAFLALMVLHPFRLEEVLGLRYEDVDTKKMTVRVRRAVTHPTRNQPEVKETKTETSTRTLSLASLALPHLPTGGAPGEFVFGGSAPLSYTQVRRMCNRIKKDTGFSENITPIRFRTTVLTDLYDQTRDIKLTQTSAGHSDAAVTLKYYAKSRGTSAEATAAVERAYTA